MASTVMNGPDPPNPNDWQAIRTELAVRIREIRLELYGEHGGPLLASALNLSFHRWADYERGIAMPADVMLRFIEHTKADPHWLLTGLGPKYTPGP